MITATNSSQSVYGHEYCIKTGLKKNPTLSFNSAQCYTVSLICAKDEITSYYSHLSPFCVTFCHFYNPNLSELLLFFKNHSPFGSRACFQFMRMQINCEDFDPGTVDEQQQPDVFLMQKMFSRPVQILETITQTRPLIHPRHNSSNQG